MIKTFEQFNENDPYGEEDWNYEETFIELRLDIDGDDAALIYKEIDNLPTPDEMVESFNRCVYVKKDYNLFQTQRATFHLLKILHEEVKKASNIKNENLFINLFKLNDKVKTLLGETETDWFDAVKNMSLVE